MPRAVAIRREPLSLRPSAENDAALRRVVSFGLGPWAAGRGAGSRGGVQAAAVRLAARGGTVSAVSPAIRDGGAPRLVTANGAAPWSDRTSLPGGVLACYGNSRGMAPPRGGPPVVPQPRVGPRGGLARARSLRRRGAAPHAPRLAHSPRPWCVRHVYPRRCRRTGAHLRGGAGGARGPSEHMRTVGVRAPAICLAVHQATAERPRMRAAYAGRLPAAPCAAWPSGRDGAPGRWCGASMPARRLVERHRTTRHRMVARAPRGVAPTPPRRRHVACASAPGPREPADRRAACAGGRA